MLYLIYNIIIYFMFCFYYGIIINLSQSKHSFKPVSHRFMKKIVYEVFATSDQEWRILLGLIIDDTVSYRVIRIDRKNGQSMIL